MLARILPPLFILTIIPKTVVSHTPPELTNIIQSGFYTPDAPAPNQNFVIVNGNFRQGCTFWDKFFKMTSNVIGSYYKRNKEFDDVQDNQKMILQEIEVTLLREKADALIQFERIHWFNFTEHNRPLPTWLTTVRNPVDTFASRWYFCRYGTPKQPNPSKKRCPLKSQMTLFSTLDECVEHKHSSCMNSYSNDFNWLGELCGSDPICDTFKNDGVERLSRLSNFLKTNLLRRFYMRFDWRTRPFF